MAMKSSNIIDPDETNKRWFPLESNPTLLNKYISKLGFDTSQYSFVDVYSTDDWALEMIPCPVSAVIMLYPITAVQEKHRKEEEKKLSETTSTSVWHIKQRIGNACGTIGILHSLANLSMKKNAIFPGSWIDRFLDLCPISKTSEEKADILEGKIITSKNLAKELEEMHDIATSDSSNQTNRGTLDTSVDTHFVAFVHVNGGLYELDGRKSGPIYHGNTNDFDLLKDACQVVKQFMERDPNEVRFTIMALAKTDSI